MGPTFVTTRRPPTSKVTTQAEPTFAPTAGARSGDHTQRGTRWETTRTFRTFYGELLAMASWLVTERGVTHVSMESTGPYWWPVYSALREVGGPELVIEVVNAAHVKAVPGRKTDVKDSQWLAQLMEVGLLRGSFLPPEQVRAMRDFTRYQTEDLRLALAGRFTAHHGQMVALHLARIDHLDQMLTQVTDTIGHTGDPAAGLIGPFTAQIELLMTIPGIGERVASVVISEIGVDMSRFPTAKHLAAWAGLAPGNNESAGKRRSGRLLIGPLDEHVAVIDDEGGLV